MDWCGRDDRSRNKLLILEMEIIKLITSVGTSQQPVQGHYYYTLLTLARLQTVYGDCVTSGGSATTQQAPAGQI